MKIDSFDINLNGSVFIIAELSANHNGSIGIAIETIKAADTAEKRLARASENSITELGVVVEKDVLMATPHAAIDFEE